jgi:HEAT repeat protein
MTDAAGVGVLTTDRHLRVRSWNAWLSSATGLPEDRVLGQSLEELTGGPTSAWYHDLFDEVLTTGTPRVLAPAFHRFLIPCAPSSASAHFDRMQQRVTVAPLRQETSIVGLIVTVEDVTWRLDAERELAAELQQDPQAALAGVGAADWKARRAAVMTLRRTASRQDLEHLIQTLQRDHRDINVLSSALQVLVAADVEVAPAFIALLSADDANLRMHAALALGQLRAEAAIPALIGALADSDVNVRFHAIEALGNIAAPEAVDALAAIAVSGDFYLGFAAIEALARTDDPRVAPRLAVMLDEESLRAPIIDTLARLGDEDSVLPLVYVLNGGGIDVPAAATALERIHARYEEAYEAGAHIADLVRGALTPDGIAALAAALARGLPAVGPIVRVLGWAGRPALAALLGTLGHPGVQASLEAAVLGIGTDAVDPLIARLEHGTREERLAAASMLGRLGDRRAVPSLAQALAGADAELASTAAGALATLGDARALDNLLPLFAHPRASVRQAAIAAVNSIGAAATRERIYARLGDGDPRVRECAIRVAGYFGYEDCVVPILAAVADPHDDVRRAAIEQLAVLSHPRCAANLVEAMSGDTPRNRAAAAHAAGYLDDPSSEQALLRSLDDPDAWVRYFAAGSVARRGVAPAVARLKEHVLGDAATHVRIAALHALARLEAPHLSHLAASLIRDADPDLAAAALSALAAAVDPNVDQLLEDAARSSDLGRRVAAVQALASRPGRKAVDVLAWAARVNDPRELRGVAIEGLRRMARGDSAAQRAAAVEALIGLAADGGDREAPLAALASLPDDAVEVIAAALKADRLSVRLGAVEALARMRHPRASNTLTQALADADAAVRASAVAAFGRLGTPAARPLVENMQDTDPDEGVRRRAATVCARHGWAKDAPRG